MRRQLLGTLAMVGLVAFFVASVLTTLRAQASGPLAVGASAMLDMGSLARLRTPLVSAGGAVARLLPDGVLVYDRHNRPLTLALAHGAILRQGGVTVGLAALEPGAHVTALGLRLSSTAFAAYKVTISPHHHAIGGLVTQILAGNLVTLITRRAGLVLVKIAPGVHVLLDGRPFGGRLRVGMRLATLAVPDAHFGQGLYVATTVRVLPATTTLRVGAIIRAIDARHHLVIVVSRTQGRVYRTEIRTGTRVTMKRWAADYADMLPGDHVTVVGQIDMAAPGAGSNVLLARFVHLSSPSFSGTIVALQVTRRGSVALTVRSKVGHLLSIVAPPGANVYYGSQPVHALDLLVGEKITARGARDGKFALLASWLRVSPHAHTRGGTVVSLLPGRLRIVDRATGRQYIIHTNAATRYTLNATSAPATVVRLGEHVRVRGYDAVHADEKAISTLIAQHIGVIMHRITHHRTAAHRPRVPRRALPRRVQAAGRHS